MSDNNIKRIYRSRDNRMIAGVCAGLADYVEIDPTIVRLLFVLGLFAGGATFWAYLIMMCWSSRKSNKNYRFTHEKPALTHENRFFYFILHAETIEAFVSSRSRDDVRFPIQIFQRFNFRHAALHSVDAKACIFKSFPNLPRGFLTVQFDHE